MIAEKVFGVDVLQTQLCLDVFCFVWILGGLYWMVVSSIFQPYLGKMSNLANIFQMG